MNYCLAAVSQQKLVNYRKFIDSIEILPQQFIYDVKGHPYFSQNLREIEVRIG